MTTDARIISMLRNMSESASLKENIVIKEIERAKTNTETKELLDTLYLDEDREASFRRYCDSAEFRTSLEEITRHADHDMNISICEIGAGHGFFAVALAQAGFRNVSILEPNGAWISGTGFISSKARQLNVRVWNSLDEWYASEEAYGLVITKACIHHFENVCKTAAEIRCKIIPGGKWIAFDEYFGSSTEDLYVKLSTHPHLERYGQYEWPYPGPMYADMICLAGFTLNEVIPVAYKNNYLLRNASSSPPHSGPITSITKALLRLKLTVPVFRLERFIFDCADISDSRRIFTVPQAFVFRRREVKIPSATAG